MAQQGTNGELKNAGYEIFIGVLSLLSIVNLVLIWALDDKALNNILLSINVVLSATFLIDFAYRLSTAPSRRTYFFRQYGWADLLASLPSEQLKILRLFRLVRVIRLLRAFGPRNVIRAVVRDRAGSALYSLLLVGVLVLEFGSLAMLSIEQNADGANIKTASDALWYVIVTISTVGYGDQYPVTTAGRVLGSIIIVIGVGIFATFTGFLANAFLAPRKAKAEAEATDARRALEQARDLLAQQAATIDELDRLLQQRS